MAAQAPGGPVEIQDVALAYERWAYGEGWAAGRVDGGRDGFAEGYAAGFDAGAEVGGARLLLELEQVIGRERLDELARDADRRLSHVGGWLDHRARTTYGPPAGRPEYRGGPVAWQPAATDESAGEDRR
jgi:hypothetical protein